MSYKGLTGKELYSERNFPTAHDVLKYDEISEKVRVQIFHQMNTLLNDLESKAGYPDRDTVFYNAMRNIKQRRGVLSYHNLLPKTTLERITIDNEFSYLYSYLSDDELEFYTLLIYADATDYLLILDLIELISYWVNELYVDQSSKIVDQMINELIRTNGIGYELINNNIIHKGNEVVHKGVVRPALYLLSEPIYDGANSEMLQAFDKFKENDFKGSIHNASNAFESTMKIIIEKNNWQLVNPNPRQSVPTLEKATASVLIHTISKNSDLEGFESLAFKSLKDTLQVLSNLRNSHTGHGQGSKIKETHIRHCEFALHTAAANILFLIRTYG
ncbi:hypothetical protein MKY22_17225 [Exiguobacterium sp. FSL W8-0210]|uniref:DUF7014 domain-containing protein n=1 Tax=Exiguobacterium sp. FSL W8-0210 TaxID=2921598 RepID=UPI0030F822F5